MQGLPIPWLVGLANGRADAGAQGALYDDQVSRLRQAVKARFPDNGPTDALPFTGGDRSQFQGPVETELHFRERLRKAWNIHELDGTAVALLVELWWLGLQDAFVIQQNGRWFQVQSTPDLDDLPACVTYGDTMDSSTGSPGPGGRVAGDPWWNIDYRDYFTSRFIVLLPTGWPPCTSNLVFDGTTLTATGNWTRPFGPLDTISTSFTVITAGGPVIVTITETTPTTVTATADSMFTGTVNVLGWVTGADPFLDPRAGELALMRKLIKLYKPGKATCADILATVNGRVWGFPFDMEWGDPGLVWGAPYTVTHFTP